MFDTGKWEWKVRQRFIKEPRIKMNDMLKILDEIKAEILSTEGKEEKKEEIKEEVADQTMEQETPEFPIIKV
jgi:flagellar basal body-associated protein FliL